jgi:glutamine amidotransferase
MAAARQNGRPGWNAMTDLSLLGYLANEPERLSCAVYELQSLAAGTGVQGLGVAHFVDDRLLLNVRPSAVAAGTSVYDMVGTLKTATFLASMHHGEDEGPYKFRSWAFAAQGCSGPGAVRDYLVDGLPDFLARNVSGKSVGEAAFHRFLAILHQQNKVDDATVEGPVVAEALRQTLQVVAGERGRCPGLCLMATNGRVLVSVHQGTQLAYSLREGILQCGRCRMDRSSVNDAFPVKESHRRFRGVVVAGRLSGVPEGFTAVPEGQVVLVTRRLDVQVF